MAGPKFISPQSYVRVNPTHDARNTPFRISFYGSTPAVSP